jgi:predicted DNA-binding transcriptional regulator AlpA
MGLRGRKRGRFATEERWLDAETTAAYLGVWPELLPRLVGQGKIPRPSYHLGYRSPRWDREELDRQMSSLASRKRSRAAPVSAEPELAESELAESELGGAGQGGPRVGGSG